MGVERRGPDCRKLFPESPLLLFVADRDSGGLFLFADETFHRLYARISWNSARTGARRRMAGGGWHPCFGPGRACHAGLGHRSGVLADRIRHYLCAAGLRFRPHPRPAFARRRVGPQKRPQRGLSVAYGDVGPALPLRIDLALSRGIFDRPVHHPDQPVAGTLAGPAPQPALDQLRLFPAQCAHQHGVFDRDRRRSGLLRRLPCAMNLCLQHSELRDIYDKVVAGQRISEADALRLFQSKDLNAVGAIAAFARQRKVGNRSSYIVNRYINYSNYCILSCQFCAFARKKRDADGFQLTVEEIAQKAREALHLGITELHIVGGLHPNLPFTYYTGMLRALKQVDARLQLKCFTAIEVLHLAWLARKTVRDTLLELRDAGLDSLTGGGAEIFRKEVRSQIAKGKESAEEYLDVHRTWHGLGGRSTCTMLYGHVEALEDRVDHLRQLRALQDETHRFVGFVPLAYQPENNDIPVPHPPTGFDSLRTIAVSRIYLDNFDHITAYWVGLGLKLAQVALSYGADDLHGTIIEEHIFHMAGATSPQSQTENAMIKAIREAGQVPVQRNTFYEPVRVVEQEPTKITPSTGNPSALLENNLATA